MGDSLSHLDDLLLGGAQTGFQQDDALTSTTATPQIKNREFKQRRRLQRHLL